MSDSQDISVVNASNDPDELVAALINLARSSDMQSHQFLTQRLLDMQFIGLLDSEEDYEQPPRHLRLSSVLDELAKNPANSATFVLLQLTQSPGFIEAPSRSELLLEATKEIRPAPPQLVAFWNWLSDPEGVYMHPLMRALAINGTRPALEIFERVIADVRHDDDRRLWWLRIEIPPRRNNIEVLYSCLRMLQGNTTIALKHSLVEALFDFQIDWFRPSTPVEEAPFNSLGDVERQQLKIIGEYAINYLELNNELSGAVKRALRQIP
jgi:hypothetical protein